MHASTHTSPFSLVLSQGPISGPRLSAQACVRGPIGSPRGCERPRGSRRIITLFISPSLKHPCIHTSTLCSERACALSFPPSLSCFLAVQPASATSEQRTTLEHYSMQILEANLLRWPNRTRFNKHMHNLCVRTNQSMALTRDL